MLDALCDETAVWRAAWLVSFAGCGLQARAHMDALIAWVARNQSVTCLDVSFNFSAAAHDDASLAALLDAITQRGGDPLRELHCAGLRAFGPLSCAALTRALAGGALSTLSFAWFPRQARRTYGVSTLPPTAPLVELH